MKSLKCILVVYAAIFAVACTQEKRDDTGIASGVHDVVTNTGDAGEVYYVIADTAEERAAPRVDAVIENRVYRGQLIRVYDIKGKWALVTAPGYTDRWIAMAKMSREKPQALPQPPALHDPRIVPDAFAPVGESGMTVEDLTILRKAALQYLESGECTKVDYGARSTTKRDTLFVMCEGRNVFFDAKDFK